MNVYYKFFISIGLGFGLSVNSSKQTFNIAKNNLVSFLNEKTSNNGLPIIKTITYQYIDINDRNAIKQ